MSQLKYYDTGTSSWLPILAGAQGVAGAAGMNGINGDNGMNGMNGDNGAQGTEGAQGAQGVQGTQGVVTNVVADMYSTSTAVTNTALIAALSDTIGYVDIYGGPTVSDIQINIDNTSDFTADVALINAAYPVGSNVIIANPSSPTVNFYEGTVTQACTDDGINILWENLTYVSGTIMGINNAIFRSSVAPTTGKYLTNDGTTSSWEEIDLTASADITMTIMGAY